MNNSNVQKNSIKEMIKKKPNFKMQVISKLTSVPGTYYLV